MTVPGPQMPFQAFTSRFSGRSLRLTTPVHIFPAFDVARGQAPTQGKQYVGLYDTGATHSAISPKVVAELNLPTIGARNVGVGGGMLATTAHLVNIGLPNSVLFGVILVAKMELLGVDALIGMDILGTGDFAVTHHDGKTVFSFCVPSRRHIDFVSEVQTSPAAQTEAGIAVPKAARNAPCPCGSGKKYKGCHGHHF